MIHDKLVFEVSEANCEDAARIIKDEMEAVGGECLKCVPVVVKVSAGEAWEK